MPTHEKPKPKDALCKKLKRCAVFTPATHKSAVCYSKCMLTNEPTRVSAKAAFVAALALAAGVRE